MKSDDSRRLLALTVAWCVVLATGGCGEATGPGARRAAVSGPWYGTYGNHVVALSLTQVGDSIAGVGWVSGYPYAVAGLVHGDSVRLDLRSRAGFPPLGSFLLFGVWRRNGSGVQLVNDDPRFSLNPWLLVRDSVERGEAILDYRVTSASDPSRNRAEVVMARAGPVPYGGTGFGIGEFSTVELNFPAGRPAPGTYQLAHPDSASRYPASARSRYFCTRTTCSGLMPARDQLGEVRITTSTAHLVAGTLRFVAVAVARDEPGVERETGAVAQLEGAFSTPCLAPSCP